RGRISEGAVRGTARIGKNASNLRAGLDRVLSASERHIVDDGGGGIVFLPCSCAADRGESRDSQAVRQRRRLYAAVSHLVEAEARLVQDRGTNHLIQREDSVYRARVGNGTVTKISQRVIRHRFVHIDTKESRGGGREPVVDAHHAGGFVGALRA